MNGLLWGTVLESTYYPLPRDPGSPCTVAGSLVLQARVSLGVVALDVGVDFFSLDDCEHPVYDAFTKVNLTYPEATVTVKVGTGVKSEGELVVSGTKGLR